MDGLFFGGARNMAIVLLLLGLAQADFVDFIRWRNEGGNTALDPEVLCDSCSSAVEALHWVVQNDTNVQDYVEGLIVDVCSWVMEPSVCSGLVYTFADIVIDTVGNHYLTPDVVCWKLHMCPSPPFILTNLTTVIEDILADSPAVLPLPPPGNETWKVLHVTDMHVDLLYEEGSNMDCSYPMCCRSSLGNTTDPVLQAGYWGSLASCDVPLRTVEAFLQQAATMDVDLILWTGDNPAHDVWAFNRETHLQQSQVLTDLFLQYFPNTPLYPIMGNHACYPEDQYHLGHEQWLTEGLADMWPAWLTPEAQATQADNAYWSMKDPLTGLRILAINSMMCDNLNFWLVLNSTDPGNHLVWLREQLSLAEAAEEKVFILGHIPTGDVFCASEWAEVYRALVNRFQNTIRGQFFGHTHQDQIQIVSSLTNQSTPAGVLYITPSFTTFSNQNPVFRVFELDKSTLQLTNYHSYQLDLIVANQNPNQTPTFTQAYDARSEYGLSDLSPASWKRMAQAMQAGNQTLLDRYWEHFYSSFNAVPECNESCQKLLWCGAQTSVLNEWIDCAGISTSNVVFYLLEQLLGPWEVPATVSYA